MSIPFVHSYFIYVIQFYVDLEKSDIFKRDDLYTKIHVLFVYSDGLLFLFYISLDFSKYSYVNINIHRIPSTIQLLYNFGYLYINKKGSKNKLVYLYIKSSSLTRSLI